MTLVQKYALLPEEIDRESLKMVEADLPAELAWNRESITFFAGLCAPKETRP